MLTLLGKIDVHSNKKRHCEVRSNPKQYRDTCIAALPLGDCFVPRNDGCRNIFGGLFNLPCRYTFIGDFHRQDLAILIKVHFIDAGNAVVAISFG